MWFSVFFLVQLKVTEEDMCACMHVCVWFYHLYLIRAFSWLCATLHSSPTHKLRKCPFLYNLFFTQHVPPFRSSVRNPSQYNTILQLNEGAAPLVYVALQREDRCRKRRTGQFRTPFMGGRGQKETGAHRFCFDCYLFSSWAQL